MPYKILIVDDDSVTLDGLASLVTAAGYEAVAASDVPAALQILADQAIDLLITDVRLDSFSGLHLIATAVRPIPSIVVTGLMIRVSRPTRASSAPISLSSLSRGRCCASSSNGS